MTVKPFGNSYVLIADEGKAIRRKGETVKVESVGIAPSDSPDNWEDCEKDEPMKYSARSILRELRALGKYEAFRQLLTSISYDWEFLSANYLSEDDADFKRLKQAVVDAGVVGSITDLDAMLAKCIWRAE